MRFKDRYIGDRSFYQRLLTIMIPIMIQNAITNLVNMLDNIMVGRIGTLEMTGVSVANQLIFVFNLCIFGAVSGAGIFSAQFYGSRDREGVRDSLRFKLMICLGLTAAALGIFFLWQDPLLSAYLKGEAEDPTAAARTLGFAKDYLHIIMIGLVPYSLTQAFSSTLRETDKAKPPMNAGLIAVSVNLVGNYILIFGHFGAPALGVKGAAIATVISRFVELFYVTAWTFLHRKDCDFTEGLFRSLRLRPGLVKRIIAKGLPLMLNEALWSSGMVTLAQCYSTRSLNVMSALNICNTFFDVFAVAFSSAGVAYGILIGQLLGADEKEQAVSDARKMIAFSTALGLFTGGIYALCAIFIPLLYNTDENVRQLATRFMQIDALMMAADAYNHATYFIIRSGGKTFITMLFDSGFAWAVQVPVAFCISRFTAMPILPFFLCVHLLMLVKMCLATYFMRKRGWVNNIVA